MSISHRQSIGGLKSQIDVTRSPAKKNACRAPGGDPLILSKVKLGHTATGGIIGLPVAPSTLDAWDGHLQGVAACKLVIWSDQQCCWHTLTGKQSTGLPRRSLFCCLGIAFDLVRQCHGSRPSGRVRYDRSAQAWAAGSWTCH